MITRQVDPKYIFFHKILPESSKPYTKGKISKNNVNLMTSTCCKR